MVTNYEFLTDEIVEAQDTQEELDNWRSWVAHTKSRQANGGGNVGRLLMESLIKAHPRLAEDFRNTACDPTHNEMILPIFIDCVDRAWAARIQWANGQVAKKTCNKPVHKNCKCVRPLNHKDDCNCSYPNGKPSFKS